jgi:hypothetical protein
MPAFVPPNPRSITAPPPAPVGNRGKIITAIRRLIYVYLLLLIFEGALRKWAFPELSNPLLIVRDPVVILIYLFAIAAGVFPRNGYVIALAIITVISWAVSFLVLLPYIPPQWVLLITGYGVRSNFLHLPLIFIMPKVFDFDDVKRIGWWTILGMIPMGMLMAAQFRASPDSFLNRAAGPGEGFQISAGGGKIRPPGTFSFISGAIFYLSATAAFLLHAALARLPYKTWILAASGLALVVGVGVSGSRAAVLEVGLVAACLGVILVLRPNLLNNFGRSLLLGIVVLWVVTRLPVFREGIGILSDRFVESAEASDTSIGKGLLSRTLEGFTEPFYAMDRMPTWGYGLGLGTNGGARFLIGHSAFLLAENEWSRVMMESGPMIGLMFILWRVVLAFYLLYLAVRQLLLFGQTLPLFLCAAGFFAILNGSFGQPTSAGFAAVLGGLCLAAMNVKKTQPTLAPAQPRGPAPRPSRSVYAARLHGPGPDPDQSNGSTDR